MALDGRYGPSDLRSVLMVNFTPQANRPTLGGILAPGYYSNAHALVLDAATDTVNPRAQKLQTIKEAFEPLRNISEADKEKKIIIPVTEEQKILGLFPRNHWVTLHYDPQTNKATLLDSRPWILSFLYPRSAMKESLIDGLSTIYGVETARETQFEIRYQGVQNNDTYCGAWTSRNIMDLAGANPQGTCTSIDQQTVAYTDKHEQNIIEYNRELVEKGTSDINIHSLPSKPNLWQRFLNFVGLNNSNEANISSEIPQPELMSWNKATQQFNAHPTHSTCSSAQKADDWEMVDDDIEQQNTTSQVQDLSALPDTELEHDESHLETNTTSFHT
ncbi:hypothetical protein [Legionella bononiensis]|uniref:Ubiquitin-like protease family profile domain-containing protein n=1 Tax=Legionella bononiensis TaxID=2793102 RepID=A0ABS1WEI6_9GAMM|nr:hypothetical protein [Legionella bononiensis]MBL7479330.1 hypothetical protein [Legionella bononiensis]MBL7479350.1 hypothetical protein [Legionella bononiensis]MBL7527766.1 hypothetical protein [Legionella bononiensis]MBL7563553.1 hypothetical protein [Legionella bononiensis]